MGQMATSMAKIEAKLFERLPSQPIENPRAYACSIMLKSGTTYAPPTPPSSSIQSPPTPSPQEDEIKPPKEATMHKLPLPSYVPVPLFPSRLRNT
uniref:Uncharacterized protein n=1 Tax=Cannabis sativa TaxID=3483 RepID=A0A803PUQ6_CANSA